MTQRVTEITRQQSYAQVLTSLSDRHQSVLDVVMNHPEGVTAFQVADVLKLPVYIIRPRLTEMDGIHVQTRGKRYQPRTKRNEAVYYYLSPLRGEERQLDLI